MGDRLLVATEENRLGQTMLYMRVRSKRYLGNCIMPTELTAESERRIQNSSKRAMVYHLRPCLEAHR
jgi:hypothetical protein